MPKGERRNKQDILISQINAKENKIEQYNHKIEKLKEEKNALTMQLQEMIEAQERAREEAENNELLQIIKKNGITKEQLMSIIDN